ncbi:MAG: class I tRNA ligase family protein [Chloroflexi bacterium]|nr:class I tRNA ligase family protein [Chloroflexota bacterium]
MFQPVSNQVDFPAQERSVLEFWTRTNAFENLRALRKDAPQRWSFVDGPITANNPMGVHHAWGRTYKDLWCRYHAMKGAELRWQQGFDCQGLWVEVNVEKELGFTTKRDIENFGMANFIALCKQRVLNSAAQQTEQSVRLGYWMDWNNPAELRMLAKKIVENPNEIIELERGGEKVRGTVEQLVGKLGMPELGGSYFTFSDENNYMIWSFLKRCHERGWIYRGTDSIPWCGRCGTGISQHEIDTEGYKDRDDPAITIRFRIRSQAADPAVDWKSPEAQAAFDATPARFILAWTTTPWTLPANVMLAIGPKLRYAIVRQSHAASATRDGESAIYFLGAGVLKMLRGDYEVLGEIDGAQMVGWTYEGLFDELPAWIDANKRWADKHGFDAERIFEHCVIPWDEVGEAEGTGVVHIAPGCGPEDHKLGKEIGSPMVAPLGEDGHYLSGFGDLVGRHAHEVPDAVEAMLKQKGFFYRRETYRHRYAHCWRCSTPLVYRLVDEWYISMDELRHDMMRVTETINWVPSFGKERELDWLHNMHDWMISKKRYWGLALPIWEYPDGTFEVIGSHEELRTRAVEGWQEFEGHTPHRPWIDGVKIKHPVTGQIGVRVTDVGNPWLDAGIVGFSTMRFRADRAYWEKWFPGQFMTESFPGQFRNWFYAMIAMSTVLADVRPADTILGFATLVDEKGEPMHKSKGNSIEFNEAADKAGADAMRWAYARQEYDDNLRFGYNYLGECRRNLLIPLWNVYSFFVTYAVADGWQPGADAAILTPLDAWILARLQQTVNETDRALDAYQSRPAALAIERFVDDLSTWYVRRSRARFWGSEMTADKQAAYQTLHNVLTILCRTLAPFTPFIAEVMWQNITAGRTLQDAATESVHHQLFPESRALTAAEEALLRETEIARRVVNLGHSVRSQSKVKVRQPLPGARIVADAAARAVILAQRDILCDELNIKDITFAERAEELVSYKVLPDLKKLGKKLGQDLPRVRNGLAALDPAFVAAEVQAGRAITVDGIALAADEIIVQAQPRPGLVVAGEAGIVVALDTELTEELISEGLAREAVRRINDARKAASFDVSDRIETYYHATPRLATAIQLYENYVKNETLSVILQSGVPENASTSVDEFDGEGFTIVLIRIH